MYDVIPGMELAVSRLALADSETQSQSVTATLTGSNSVRALFAVRGIGNCDFTLQIVKYSCESLVRKIVTYSFIIFIFASKLTCYCQYSIFY